MPPKIICEICKKFHVCPTKTKVAYFPTQSKKFQKKKLIDQFHPKKISKESYSGAQKNRSPLMEIENQQTTAAKPAIDTLTKIEQELVAKRENINESKSEFENFYEELDKNKHKFQRHILGCYFILGNTHNSFTKTTKIFKEWIESSNENLLKQAVFLFGCEKNKEIVFGVIFSNLVGRQKAKLVIYKEVLNLVKMDNFKQIDPSEIYFVENYWTFKPIAEQILLDGVCMKINNNNVDKKKLFMTPNSIKSYELSKKINFIINLEELKKREIYTLYISSKRLKDDLKIENLDDFKKFTWCIFCKKKKISGLELLCWVYYLRKYSKQQSYDDIYNSVPISKTNFIFAIWQKINNDEKISYDEIKRLWNTRTKKHKA